MGRPARADRERDRIDQVCLAGLIWTGPVGTHEQVSSEHADRTSEAQPWRRCGRADDFPQGRRFDLEKIDRARTLDAQRTVARGADEQRPVDLPDDRTEVRPFGRERRAERA